MHVCLSCRVESSRVESSRVVSYRVVSAHVVSCRLVSCRVMSYRVVHTSMACANQIVSLSRMLRMYCPKPLPYLMISPSPSHPSARPILSGPGFPQPFLAIGLAFLQPVPPRPTPLPSRGYVLLEHVCRAQFTLDDNQCRKAEDHLCAHMCACMRACACVCVRACMHARLHVYVRACMRACGWRGCMCEHTWLLGYSRCFERHRFGR